MLGIAADDIVRVSPEAQFEVIERGRNLAVQVYGRHEDVDEITKDVWELGGALDGRADNLTVYTIPVTAGFPASRRCSTSSSPATRTSSGTSATSTTPRTGSPRSTGGSDA